jgi:hypothetical protein
MAPEQADGTATERSDQFSFCVTAYEALHGVRPFAGASLEAILANVRAGRFVAGDRRVPARIERALRRGLAADPEARYPTMAALLAALVPRSRRRWWWLAPIAAAGGAVAIWLALRGGADAPDCAATRAELFGVWNPGRAAALRHVLADRVVPAAADELVTRVDDRATRWLAVREQTCAATAQLSTEQLAARLACLRERSDELDGAIRRLEIDRADSPFDAWERIAGLWPAEACRDDAAARLAVGNPVHEKLMRDLAAADIMNADTTPLVAMRARADAAGDEGALLEIDLAIGRALLYNNNLKSADVALRSALGHAEHLGIAAKRLAALALLATSACKQQRFDESAPLLMMADADVRRGGLEAIGGRASERAGGWIDADAVVAAHGECLVQQRSLDAVPLLRDLAARVVARYGPDSPAELRIHSLLVDLFAALDRTEDVQRELVIAERISRRFVRPGADAAQREVDAGTAAFERGDLDGAIEHARTSIELWDRDHEAERTNTLANLALYYELSTQWRLAAGIYDTLVKRIPPEAVTMKVLRVEALLQGAIDHLQIGELDIAAAGFDQAAVEARAAQYTAYVFESELGRGRVAVERRDFVRAVRVLEDALPGYIARPDAVAYRVGSSQFALARALWETGDHARAIATAAQAESYLGKSVAQARASPIGARMAAFRTKLVTEVAAWRDTHR